MISLLLSALGVVVAFLVLIAAVFVGGMRSKWPPVIDRVRRMNRRFMNPQQLQTAGQPGAYAGVLRHTGRSSGKPRETPLGIVRIENGFIIGMVYGDRADWVRNVMAAGHAEIVYEGDVHPVDQPEIVPTTDLSDVFSSSDRVLQRLLAIDQCMRLRIATRAV